MCGALPRCWLVQEVVMQQIAIVTDSISCLTKELVEQYGIKIIPLNFYAGGKLYKDWVYIRDVHMWPDSVEYPL